MRPADTVGLKLDYLSFHDALSDLYGNETIKTDKTESEPDFDDMAFFDAAGMVYKAGSFDTSMLNTPKARRLIGETLRHIRRAIDSGVPHEVPEVVRHALENNAFIFSGFKAFHTLREVGLSLTTDKGEIKPFEQFRRDVETVNNRYNHNYLYAEYNHAVGASLMAARWQQIEKDGDRYDLQYRTAQDDRVREDHAILHNTTLPPSDPFWSLYLPPNGWNCRCQAVQVRKGKYPQSDPDLSMLRGNNCTEAAKQQIFRFNPGKELNLFPSKHPYYKGPKPEQVKQAIDGYTPAEWTPKTVAEAEQFIADKLGVRCSFKGFKKKDIAQIEEIFRCVERHFQCYPELKKKINFVGSMQGRQHLYTEHLFNELRKIPANASFSDDDLMKHAKKLAIKYMGKIPTSAYAYSAPGLVAQRLNGVAFNATYTGEKVQKFLTSDAKAKYHPVGCDTVKSIFDHELGHKLDELLGIFTDSEFLKIFNEAKKQGETYITDNLSHYSYDSRKIGKPNYTPEKEFFAEAWSEYLNNETPRPIAAAVGAIVRARYEAHQASSSSK